MCALDITERFTDNLQLSKELLIKITMEAIFGYLGAVWQ